MIRKLVLLLIALSTSALLAERRVAVIVDTSGSMSTNDHARYAVQISKILSDIVEDGDRLAIIRFPRPGEGQGGPVGTFGALQNIGQGGGQNCSVGANPDLKVELSGSDRARFKQSVDQMLAYTGPTFFGAPLRTATSFLGQDRNTPRLLLMVTDAEEGFGNCREEYTKLLQEFGQGGATVALIRLGSFAEDGFANNHAIQIKRDVKDSANLIEAVAEVYQRFLGSRLVQKGRMSGGIRVQIPAHVKDAYLVVAADSTMGELRAASGNPASAQIDFNYRGGGETQAVGSSPGPLGSGQNGEVRGYRIVHMVNPNPGSYGFQAPAGVTGGWMLLLDYSLEVRMITSQVPAKTDSEVQFEVIDQRTGQRVTDPSTLSSLRIDGKIDGKDVKLTNSGGGVFSTRQRFGGDGTVPVEMRLSGGAIDKSSNFTLPVGTSAVVIPPAPPQLAKSGDIDFGNGTPITLGRIAPGASAQSRARFEGGRINSPTDILVSTDFAKRNVELEMQTPDGWRKLSAHPVKVHASVNNALQWPIRVHAGKCPAACKADETHKIFFVVPLVDGSQQRAEIPVKVEITPDPWWVCWRNELLALLAMVLIAVIAYGFISPFRFPPRTGLQLADSEDLSEGSFFPLRAAPGHRSGFYRDACLYLTESFRVTRKKRGAFVRLRAGRNCVLLQPVHGRSVYCQQPDDSWEPIPSAQETIARPGKIFRNEGHSIFFEVRTK